MAKSSSDAYFLCVGYMYVIFFSSLAIYTEYGCMGLSLVKQLLMFYNINPKTVIYRLSKWACTVPSGITRVSFLRKKPPHLFQYIKN